MKLIIINGPNLNLLGTREPDIYGSQTFETFLGELKRRFSMIDISYFQSNHEGQIIDKIHEIGFTYDGIIINAGGLTHTSVALADALGCISTKAVEVHISNIHAREEFRKHSYLTPKCVGLITGLGLKGYELAVEYFLER